MENKCQSCGQPLNYEEEIAGDEMCQWCFEEIEREFEKHQIRIEGEQGEKSEICLSKVWEGSNDYT